MQDPRRDLWVRLAALNKCCVVKLESFYTSTDPITSVLRWRITIQRRMPTGEPPIIVEADGAVEAMTEGIDRAEHVGWHRT